jgi:outer membrane protein assembly factor BamE (lipoprotein component of BamABCDE complex)
MNASTRPCRYGILALSLIAGIGLAGCLHQANEVLKPTARHAVADLQPGMTQSDVTSLLGEPEHATAKDTDQGHVETWVYSYPSLVLRVEDPPGSVKYDNPQPLLTREARPDDPDKRTVTLTFVNGGLTQVVGPK